MKKILALDKLLHALVCYFIAASLFILFGWVWLAVCAAMFAGLIKEWIDGRRWSWGDIVADVVGVAVFLAQVYI